MSALKILKDGNRITYILVRDNENIPLLTVEDGKLSVEKTSTEDYEVTLALIAALRHAVLRHVPPNPPQEPIYHGCLIAHFFWCFEKALIQEEAKEVVGRNGSA